MAILEGENTIRRKRLVVFLFSLLVLAGCSSKDSTEIEADKILSNAYIAHQDVTYVYIEEEVADKNYPDEDYKAIAQYDFADEKYLYETNDQLLILYQDKRENFAIAEGEYIDAQQLDFEEESFNRQFKKEYQQNPLNMLKKFDENFHNNFDVRENNRNYILTYKGDKDAKLAILQGIYWSSHLQFHELVGAYKDLKLTDTALEITAIINKETNLLELMKIHVKFNPPKEFINEPVEYTTVHKYSKYNEDIEIEKPEYAGSGSSAFEEVDNDSEKQIMQYEKEAAEYVDALIQATVFQNVDEYVKRAPGAQSDEEKKKEGATQQSLFRTIFEQNTMDEMGPYGVTKEQVSEFTSAFLEALSITEYEVVDATFRAEDKVKVKLFVRGIDDVRINSEVREQLIAEIDSGEVVEEDVLNRNVELLIEAYRANEELLDDHEMYVDVLIDSDGTYKVLIQDQFLKAFAQ